MPVPQPQPKSTEDYQKYLEVNAEIARQISNLALLNQTITNPPTQAEVQAISDKIDALLNIFK